MQICHGRRRCNLAADANTFGSPCQPNSRMYLKVVYTCGKLQAKIFKLKHIAFKTLANFTLICSAKASPKRKQGVGSGG